MRKSWMIILLLGLVLGGCVNKSPWDGTKAENPGQELAKAGCDCMWDYMGTQEVDRDLLISSVDAFAADRKKVNQSELTEAEMREKYADLFPVIESLGEKMNGFQEYPCQKEIDAQISENPELAQTFSEELKAHCRITYYFQR